MISTRTAATAAALAAAALLTSGCGAIVSAGLSAESVESNTAVVDEAERRVAAATSTPVGRVPGASGDCTTDARAVEGTMRAVGGRSQLDAAEELALARLAGLVAACGGQVDAALQAAFDAG